MPRGDGTGPMGMGAMTGRGAGFCAGYGVPGYMNPVMGRGAGMMRGGFCGRGGGRGWRNQFYATGMPGWQRAWGAPQFAGMSAAPTREEQVSAMKQQAEHFEGALADIRARIKELEASKDAK